MATPPLLFTWLLDSTDGEREQQRKLVSERLDRCRVTQIFCPDWRARRRPCGRWESQGRCEKGYWLDGEQQLLKVVLSPSPVHCGMCALA